jgi:hypothetical protein
MPEEDRSILDARLIPAKAGDLVTIDGPLFPEAVAQRCRDGESRLFACLICRRVIPNRFHMEQHILQSPSVMTHQIVRRCREHDAWEPAFVEQQSLFPEVP